MAKDVMRLSKLLSTRDSLIVIIIFICNFFLLTSAESGVAGCQEPSLTAEAQAEDAAGDSVATNLFNLSKAYGIREEEGCI